MRKDITILNTAEKIDINVEYDEKNDEEIGDLYYHSVDEKIIKEIERIIRSSYEYEKIVLIYKNVMGLNYSTFYPNYSAQNGYKLELHHSPFTLFEIVETVCNKFLMENKGFTDMDIAKEVLILHFRQCVGLMPVDPTSHELIHSQTISIHPYIPHGDWETFIKEYKKYMSEELLEKVKDIERMAKEEIPDSYDIFKVKTTVIKNSKIQSIKDYNLEKLIPNISGVLK